MEISADLGRTIPRLILVGDSITEYGDQVGTANSPGWVALLRSKYGTRAHVMNYGASGYNTCWGMQVLDTALTIEPLAQTDVVVLFFGSNDAHIGPSPQSVPIDEYEGNLEEMIRRVRSRSKAEVLLVTPPAICNKTRGPERRFERTAQYAEACKRVGARMHPKVCVADTHGAMVRQGGGEEEVGQFVYDGLHLNERGNALVEAVVVDALERLGNGVGASKVGRAFRDWKSYETSDL